LGKIFFLMPLGVRDYARLFNKPFILSENVILAQYIVDLNNKNLKDRSTLIYDSSTKKIKTEVIPNLDASKITSGQFSTDRIPNLDASKITSGVLTQGRIPSLNFNKMAWTTKFFLEEFDESIHNGDYQVIKYKSIENATIGWALFIGCYCEVKN